MNAGITRPLGAPTPMPIFNNKGDENGLNADVINGILYIRKPDGSVFQYGKKADKLSKIGRHLENWHDYPGDVVIAKKGTTTLDNAFRALRYAPAPVWRRHETIKSGEVENIIGPLGDVETIVLPRHRTILNITKNHHGLSPGIVIRHVYEDRDGNIRAVTRGLGNGILPTPNEFLGRKVFENFDRSVTRKIVKHFGKKPIPEKMSHALRGAIGMPTDSFNYFDIAPNGAKQSPKASSLAAPEKGPERVKQDPDYNPFDISGNGFLDLEGEAYVWTKKPKIKNKMINAARRQNFFKLLEDDVF